MAMPATTNWTADMVRALPDDGKRYEVIDGELFVTPAPTFHHPCCRPGRILPRSRWRMVTRGAAQAIAVMFPIRPRFELPGSLLDAVPRRHVDVAAHPLGARAQTVGDDSRPLARSCSGLR
jgi:hypothetical protein